MIARLRAWLQQRRIDEMEIRLARLLAERAEEIQFTRQTKQIYPAVMAHLAGDIAQTQKILELLKRGRTCS